MDGHDNCGSDRVVATTAPTIGQRMRGPIDSMFDGALIAHALRGDGFDASEDGTGRGTPIIAQPLRAGRQYSDMGDGSANVIPVAFANTAGDTALGMSKPGVPPITRRNGDPGNVLLGMQVRRLTPRECERLQGFPDDYTLIPYNGKPAKDGPRYKALGNSMAVPVMRWIGKRIAMVDSLQAEQEGVA
jgi:DNA (cytosine-5)-methyltransferase 1